MRSLQNRLPGLMAGAIFFAACSPDSDRSLAERLTASAEPTTAALAPLAATVAWYQIPRGVAVANDAADNVYIARWDYNPAGDIYLAKRDLNGNLLWEVRYDNTDNTRHEVATWTETDPSGNVYVSGTIRSGYSSPVNANSILMKFNAGGQLLWRRVFNLPFDGSSTRKVLVDETGAAYVFGVGVSPAGQRTTVRKYAPDGTLAWVWFDPVGVGSAINIKWGADRNLVISARAIFGIFNGYAKIDRSGNTLWTLAGIQSMTLGDIAGDAGGNAYIVNASTTGSGSFLRKLSPTGQLIWQRGSPVGAQRVEVGTDNAAVMAGYPSVGFGAAFAKFDANGNPLWQNLDADGPSTNLLAHGMLMLDAGNNAYLAASNMSQMGVVKVLAASGVTDWMQLIPFGYAVDLAFGQNQRVFVVGGGTVARIDQQGSPPPVNTPPVVSIVATTPTTIPVNGTFGVRATLVDPDVGDGPWPYTWKWGNGPVTGTRTRPGVFSATRTYPRAGNYMVRIIVTDGRGAADTSNVINLTVR